MIKIDRAVGAEDLAIDEEIPAAGHRFVRMRQAASVMFSGLFDAVEAMQGCIHRSLNLVSSTNNVRTPSDAILLKLL